MRLAYVDGRMVLLAAASVPVEDRGLQFADSVYEVCAALNGRLLDWPLHLDRLTRNLATLGIAPPISPAALTLVARRLLVANRAAEALLYIQITRGVAKRDHGFNAEMRPTLMMTVQRFDFVQRVAQQVAGVAIVSMLDQRWGRCDLKTTGLLANVLAKQAARGARAFEALLVDDEGIVAEGSSTNVWAVLGGTLVTPPLSPRVLPGVMRATLLRLAAAEGFGVTERSFNLDDAIAADELMLSSTTVPVLPVVQLDGHVIADGKPGPIAANLARLIWNEIAVQTGYRPAGLPA